MLSRATLWKTPVALGFALKAAVTAASIEGTRFASTNTEVTIGDVSKSYPKPKRPEYVPRKYLPSQKSQKALRHLRWMLQKDLLGQDMFLIGRPGPSRRRLAMEFLELTGREVEFVSLSRDTTEADLKQRRELRDGTAKFFDQSAVRAAVEGRVLVLEGVEKAERNVLPVLNNLLENREMHLEDGRFLVPASRYDKLLKENSQEELDRWRLVRVSEDFRVIALGLPVPKYPGNPLDPPLRSRFQAHFVGTDTFKDVLEELQDAHPDADPADLSVLVSACMALLSPEASSLSLPDCPISGLYSAAKLLSDFKGMSVYSALSRVYPYRMVVPPGNVEVVDNMLTALGVSLPKNTDSVHVTGVAFDGEQANVKLSCQGSTCHVKVPCGNGTGGNHSPQFVETAYQKTFLGELVQSHSAGDICIIGPRGCGKSATLLQLASTLKYIQEPIVLYQDMTSRDLIQQRTTKPNGDTVWNNSPLVTAALEGNLAVLDGLHRIHPSTFSFISRLVQDRELQLHDGKRLIRHDRFDSLKADLGLTDEQLNASGVLRIHPSFRIVALSEKSKEGGASKGPWLTSEMLSMFMFHEMRPLNSVEELSIIEKLYGSPSKGMKSVVELASRLRNSSDPTLRSISSSLSTRQLLRIARRLAAYPSNNIHNTVQRACLSRFLPIVPRRALTDMLSELGIRSEPDLGKKGKKLTCSIVGDQVHIGNTIADRYPDTAAKTKVPDILFYDVPQHVEVLEELLQDFVLGEHILLVGNQGVGKNKLADRLLQVLNRPREYIQLHRDTTVQTLTLQPTVRDGIVVFDDSPLVTAVKLGHVLMVDEADKAPTHVTCILKTLVESGEMILSDGRRIVPHNDNRAENPSPNIIPMHPDFRMIVMANRPGFPFLGNDFFGALGDLFSCHDIDNPSQESEVALLKSYGPDVPDALVQKLVRAFGDLRSMADQGLVSYPYSTREVVNIVRHLQQFPEESLTSVVSNVFDFDRESQEVISTLVEVLHKHGIPIGARPDNIALATEIPLPPMLKLGKWQSRLKVSSDLMVAEQQLKVKSTVNVRKTPVSLDYAEVRSSAFTEMQSYCVIPIQEMSMVTSLAVAKAQSGSLLDDVVYIVAVNPLTLITLKPVQNSGTAFKLEQAFGETDYSSVIKMFPLEDTLQDCVLLHEDKSNTLVVLDTKSGEATRISTGSFLDSARETISRGLGRSKPPWSISRVDGPNRVALHENGTGHIALVDFNTRTTHSTRVPIKLRSIHSVSSDIWLLSDDADQYWTLKKTEQADPFPSVLTPLKTTFKANNFGNISNSSQDSLSDEALLKAIGQGANSSNRLFATDKTLAAVVIDFPGKEGAESEVFAWRRETGRASSPSLIMKDIGQVIRFCEESGVPVEGVAKAEKETRHEGQPAKPLLGYMEVVDVLNNNVRYIPVPDTLLSRPSAADFIGHVGHPLLLDETTGSGLVSVDRKGCVRLWETGTAQLARSLDAWQKLVGKEVSTIQATVKRDSGMSTLGPKHGKVDPLNTPHVGGNTWAGGTGGRDTAGLGGKGGPYRLDAGHTVHQLSDEEKADVPDHVKKAAREMGKRAFSQRIREINMSPYDATLYDQFYSSVTKQIQTLRVMLSNLQAKSKERQWMRHQTSGELDDTKLIEGLTGEKTIYKRRAEAEREIGSPFTKPKRVRLVVDVSGSMYRFNGYDKRLDRELEAVVLVMEAFQGFEERIRYDILGHSGEGHGISFVGPVDQPTNNKERLQVIKTMHAHAQFCMAGDHTLEATRVAVSSLAEEDADEAIVVVLSDANLERYRIPPKRFAKVLTENSKVNAYAIFIGSLGDQAERLKRQLPAGRAFVCMDLKDIPQILQEIFTASMLN